MVRLIEGATIIQTTGSPPMKIEEFMGRLNTKTDAVSIARMLSPSGWKEAGQVCRFDEYALVLNGILHLSLRDGEMDVREGQAVIVPAGEWVQYSTPSPEGAEYIAVMFAGILAGDREQRSIVEASYALEALLPSTSRPTLGSRCESHEPSGV